MMKKVLLTSAISATFLFSGCTVPFMSSDDDAIVVSQVETSTANTLAQENPEQLFFDFAKASGGNILNAVNKAIPDRELLVKQKGKFSIDGDFDMEGTPIGGGTGTFSVNADVLMDYSDSENVTLSEAFDVKVDALGGFVKVDAKGEIRIVDNSFFGMVESLDFNFPGANKDIKSMAQNFVGQWYGDSFDALQEMAGDDLDGMDLKQMFSGADYGIKLIEMMEDVAKNPENHIEFGKFVKEENGYYFFEVTPKKESYQSFADIFLDMIPAGQSETDDMKEDVMSAIDKLASQKVMVAYTPENSEYFKISTLDGMYTAEKTGEGCSMVAQFNEDGGMNFMAKDGKYSLEITELGEVMTPLTGTYTDSSMTFEASAPSYDYELGESVWSIMANGSFTKSGDTWSGEITSPVPELENSKLVFSEMKADAKNMSAKISAVYDDTTIGTININGSSEKLGNASVDKPENTKTFTVLMEEVEKEMNTLYGLEEVEGNTLDTSTGGNLENDDDNQTDTSVEAGSVIEVESIDPIVPVINEAEIEVVPAAEVETEVEVKTSSNMAEIEPLLIEMATMMGDAPTPESQAKFMEMKESVDALAAANGVTEEELGELFMKVVSENQPVIPSVPVVPAQ